jgi:UDP-glucuronate decarboxylase
MDNPPFLLKWVIIPKRIQPDKMHQIIEQDVSNILSKISWGKFKDKSILITGANGLIGTYIISTLYSASEKHNLNLKITGISKSVPNCSIQEIMQRFSDFHFLQENLAESFTFDGEVDYAIHAATYSPPAKFLENKFETIALNTIVTEKLLHLCRKNRAAMLFVSSSEVYGQAQVIPTPETYNGNCPTTQARSVYSESKRLGETICTAFRDEGVEVRIARVSATYGPGITIRDKRVMGNFIYGGLGRNHIGLVDSGKQERTWLYISDCVAMLLNILLHGKHFVYNIGGYETVSILELARMISEITGSTYSIPEHSAHALMTAPDIVKLDISRVSEEFQINEFVSLKEGLKRTINWNKDLIREGALTF